jgi:hypothetical protein
MLRSDGPVRDRMVWFCVLLAFLKLKAMSLWQATYPNGSNEDFELVWPTLLDEMLASANRAAVDILAEKCPLNMN